MRDTLRRYYRLSKPGIVYGNTLTLISGLAFAWLIHQTPITMTTILGVIIGTGLIMASACALNNVLDRDIDRQMQRTKYRELASGQVLRKKALIYTLFTLVAGTTVLLVTTALLPTIIALVAWLLYAVHYTYFKRLTYHATLLGSIPGAAPPVIGYIAGGGTNLLVGLVLFAIVVTWQMMHFYAIALRRQDDYRTAGIPVISVVKDSALTIWHIEAWTWLLAALLIASMFLAPFPYGFMALAISVWLLYTVHAATPPLRLFIVSLQFLLAWFLVLMCAVLWIHLSKIWF